MRQRLIDATIACLATHGHAATTTIRVAELAGVSRGAMLHHFPSRAELLLATARHIIEAQRKQRRQALRQVSRGQRRMAASADISWKIHRQPDSVALLELLMATRAEPMLKDGLSSLAPEILALRSRTAEGLAEDLGIADVDAISDMLHLHQAVLRGLAIEMLLDLGSEQVERSRQLYLRVEQEIILRLKNKAPLKKESLEPTT